MKDALLYIEQLHVPKGYDVENRCIYGASSMTEGYQAAMKSSDAKYKIYMHQDVCIINRNFLYDLLSIFETSDQIGMIGMVGTKKLPSDACMWSTSMRTGALRYFILSTLDTKFDVPISKRTGYTYVEAIDGLMMITQYDLDWRTDLFQDWDFYDISQSMEFRKAGYRIVVPEQEEPWTIHNDDVNNFSKYHLNRKKFLQEYFPGNKEEILLCDIAHKEYNSESFKEIEEDLNQLLCEQKYEDISKEVYKLLNIGKFNEKIVFLFLICQINEREKMSSVAKENSIYEVMKNKNLQEICQLVKRVKLYMMRIFYNLSAESQTEAIEFFEKSGISQVAVAYLEQLMKPSSV